MLTVSSMVIYKYGYLLGRLLLVDLITLEEENVRPSVGTSVRTDVRTYVRT